MSAAITINRQALVTLPSGETVEGRITGFWTIPGAEVVLVQPYGGDPDDARWFDARMVAHLEAQAQL